MISDHTGPGTDCTRDALALIRCVLGSDRQGTNAIIENTRCPGCLAVSAATVAILLAAGDGDLLPGSRSQVIMAEHFQHTLDTHLRQLLQASYEDETADD